jgi:iron complex outermembrane receptor protein
LLANLSAYVSDRRDGWGRDLVTGEDAFTALDYGGRAKFLWAPWQGGRFLLGLSYNYTRSEVGIGVKPIPGSPFRSFLTDLAAVMPQLVPPADFYDTYAAPNNDESVTDWRAASLRFEQDLGWAQLVSITGWQQQRGHFFFNQEGSPLAVVYAQIYQSDDNRSQEFQLISPDGALRWILGAFLYWDKAGYDPLILRGAAFGFPDPLGPDMLFVDDDVTTTSYAAYAQTTAEIADDTNLTLGLRYTDDNRAAQGGMTSISSGIATPLTSRLPERERSWSKLTYRASLDHKFSDDVMAYLSFNRGFKSGVYDLVGFAAPGLDPNFPDGRSPSARPVDPEILDAYEIGAKARFPKLALDVNVAAFFNDFQNIQVVQIVVGGTRTMNAGAAEISGLEIEFSTTPADRLHITGGISLMDGEYTDFPVGPRWSNNPAPFPAPPLIATDSDLTGNTTIQTPSFSATLALSYAISMTTGDLDLDLAYYYNDGFFWEPDNSTSQPSYNLINASVDWTSRGGGYELRLWGRNLADEKYFSWASTSGVGALFSPAAPRTYGITLSRHM